jgi:type II secretory pathway component PulF
VPFRVIRDYQSSIFLTSLASLLGAGETTVRSLEKLKRRGTPWLGWHISKITHRLLSQSSKNANYGEAFATGIFDRDLTNRLIDLSRRSSNFGGVIQRLGIAGIEDAKKRVEKSAKILNVVLTVVLGGFIAYLLIATIVTAQSLSGKLKAEVTRTGTGMTHNMHHK